MNRSKLAYALLSSLVIAVSLENAVGGGHSYEKGDKVDLWMNKVRLSPLLSTSGPCMNYGLICTGTTVTNDAHT